MAENIEDIWQLWGFNTLSNSNTVINTVNQNVIQLVNLILKEDPTTLVQVGRKAAHLIREYKNQIEKKFLICLLLMHNFNNITQYKPSIPKDKPVILIADTIHHGRDLEDVLHSFKNENIQVNKVFCYLKNQDGVNNLVKQGLLKEEQVVSLFTSHSELKYRENAKDLHAYFRSHIEPTDSESCYNVYKVNTQLNVEQIVKMIEPTLFKTFGTNSMEEIADKGFTSNIQEISYNTTNNEILQKAANDLIKNKNNYNVLGLNLRFKIKQQLIDSEFSIIPKIEANCVISEVNNQKCFTHDEYCILNQYTHENVGLQELKNTICPQCLDAVVSDYLLWLLNDKLVAAFKKSGLELILKEKNRPIGFAQ